MNQTVRRVAGAVFGVGGAALFVAGLLHPQGERGGSFRATIGSFLQDPDWPVAHWLALAAALPIAAALWVLMDDGWTRESALARAGGRLLLIGLPFMALEFAVELAATGGAEAYVAGRPAAIVDLTEPMQVVGFPALGLGLAALALGLPSAAPRVLAVLAAIGGVVVSVGAVLVEGFHLAAVGPAFAGLALPTLWMVWAGARLAAGRSPSRERAAADLPA